MRDKSLPPVEGPHLVPMYGASMEPLATLKCTSVHPCKRCGSSGYINHVACERCRGTGIAEIRKGSMLYCEVCSKSGMDHLPIMKIDPATMPKPEPKNVEPPPPTPAAAPSQTRKEKRKALQPA